MRVWALINPPPVAYDTAYLLGRLLSRANRLYVTRGKSLIEFEQDMPPTFDVIFNRTIQSNKEILDSIENLASSMNVVLINSSKSTRRASDKRTYINDFARHIPESWIVKDAIELLSLHRMLGYDLVLKHPFGKCGKEIVRFSSEADLMNAQSLFSIEPKTSLVAQRFCEEFKQGDKRVIVHRLPNRLFEIVAWYKRIPNTGGWISNLSAGGRIEKCDLTSEEEEFSLKMAEIANLDYVGLDIGWDNGRCLLIETNAYTGGHMDFDAIHQDKSSGDQFAKLVAKLCK